MKKEIMGVKIDDVTMDEAVALVEEWLKKTGKYYIVTPNPEFIVAAQKDQLFRKILNDADLSIPDGIGLKLSGKIKNTVTGTDLMEKLIYHAAEIGLTTGFLGGQEGVAEKTAKCLRIRYPKLKISFATGDLEVNEDGREVVSSKHNTKYIIPNTDLLFVAFGPPKQEKWIAKNLDKTPAKVMMGVGGAFDYLSGQVPRAPKFIRDLGFEWLFRLFMQPWRIKRQMSLIKYLLMLI